jgi:hypothetical protein
MEIYLSGLLWVAGAAFAAAATAYVIRRIGATEGTVQNNEAAGQVFTLVGGLQAVLVAFVLISLFDGVTAAEDGSYTEANGLVAVVWAAEALPGDAGADARAAARRYANSVVTEEWPRLRAGEPITDNAAMALDQLRTAVLAAPATDEWTAGRKAEASDQLWQVYQARQDRLAAATTGSVNTVVWFALLAGAVMSIALPLMFGGPRPTAHIIIVSTLAATMALLLFATARLENPYSGGAQVEPTAFQAALDRL